MSKTTGMQVSFLFFRSVSTVGILFWVWHIMFFNKEDEDSDALLT
jgi:hypothetical protein